MEELDAMIVRECGVALGDVEDMGLFDKMLVLGYRFRETPRLRHNKPPEQRMPRKR